MAIDISETIIHVMRQQYKDLSGVVFSVMDVRELNAIPSNSISVAIDKACIDAIFCSTNFLNDSKQAFKEIHRVLANNGVFTSFSHAPSNCRVPFLRCVDWSIDCCTSSYGIFFIFLNIILIIIYLYIVIIIHIQIEIGEGIQMYTLTKTTDKSLLNKKVDGGEIVILSKASNAVSSLEQQQVKSSQTKNSNSTGFVTVTASVDILAEMVNESEDIDS